MESQDRKQSIWCRIKQFLFGDLVIASDSKANRAKVSIKAQFLERCLLEDCLTEKHRKQLERQWQEVSY